MIPTGPVSSALAIPELFGVGVPPPPLLLLLVQDTATTAVTAMTATSATAPRTHLLTPLFLGGNGFGHGC